MSEDSTVVRLEAVRNGFPAADLREWVKSWADSPSFDPEDVRTVVIVVESKGGLVNCVPQGSVPMDGVRLVGLLEALKHRILHGKGIGL